MQRRSWWSCIKWALLTAAVTSWPARAAATTIRVPEDVATVLAAGDLAAPGDTILVGPGTWTDVDTRVLSYCNGLGTFSANAFLRPGIALIGSGIETTIIEHPGSGGGLQKAILMVNEVGPASRIESLTIRGTDTTQGIYAFCPSLRTEVRNCRIEGHGQGAARFQDQDGLLEECVVVGNGGDSLGRVVRFLHASAVVRACRFERNATVVISGGLQIQPTDTVEITDCVFENNRPATCISISESNECTIERNLFLRNFGNSTGVGAHVRGTPSVVRFNTFAYDSTSFSPGGLLVESNSDEFYQVIVEHNTFWGCHAAGNGAAVAILSAEPIIFRNNLIAASTGAPAMWRHGAFPQAISSCNDYWNNAEGHFNDWVPGATDFYEDPRLCDPELHDFRLMMNSPCAPDSPIGCGLVGAWDVGCGTVSLTPRTWGEIKSFYR